MVQLVSVNICRIQITHNANGSVNTSNALGSLLSAASADIATAQLKAYAGFDDLSGQGHYWNPFKDGIEVTEVNLAHA